MPMRYVVVALLAFALGVFVLLDTLFYSDRWGQRESARADLLALTAQNDATEMRIRGLRAQIEGLRTRPEVQERTVRHELGYAKPGEIVLELGTSDE